VVRGRGPHIRINKAKDMQKPISKTGDCLAGIYTPILEDVASFPRYVDDRLLLGEFTGKIVLEETRFTYKKAVSPSPGYRGQGELTDTGCTHDQDAR